MATVELIYDADCLNVARAREQLLKALAAVKLPARWTEWNRSDPVSPGYVQHYGSPTILINGQDVAGVAPGEDASSCRIYQHAGGKITGVPTVEEITAALAATAGESKRGVRRVATFGRRLFPAVPSSVVSLLPVGACPACWPVYAGVLSLLGMGFLLETTYLLPLTVLFLAVAVFALGYRARRRWGYAPFALGIVASLLLVIGKFVFNWNPATYAGLALLMVASFWNAWPRREKNQVACPACSEASRQPTVERR
jgi:hypothetical protein